MKDDTIRIDSFRDMSDRPVEIDVWAGQILIHGYAIRLNNAIDIDRMIEALTKARDIARGGR